MSGTTWPRARTWSRIMTIARCCSAVWRLTSARAERANQRAEKLIAALVNRPLKRHRR